MTQAMLMVLSTFPITCYQTHKRSVLPKGLGSCYYPTLGNIIQDPDAFKDSTYFSWDPIAEATQIEDSFEHKVI